MKNTILQILLLAATLSARGEWRILESRDEMTDAMSYSATLAGDPVRVSDFTTYKPILCARFTPKKFYTDDRSFAGVQDVIFSLDVDSTPSDAFKAIVRFDQDDANALVFTPSTDCDCGFFRDPATIIQKLKTSNDLRIRLTTMLGHVRTLHFSTAGFAAAIDNIRDRIESTRPKSIAFIAPAQPETVAEAETPKKAKKRKPITCSKCRGRGEVTEWQPCPHCGGKGTIYSARCSKCATSAKRGKVKVKVKCSNCHGVGQL